MGPSPSLRKLLLICLRTFLQAFAGALAAGPVVDVRLSVVNAAALAGLAAAFSAAHNAILDPSPVPSLEVDRP